MPDPVAPIAARVVDDLIQRADQLAQALRGTPGEADIADAAQWLVKLRDKREFRRLCDLAELVSRLQPGNFKARRLHAQGLVETGRLNAAVGLLEQARRDAGDDPELPELNGLLGRACKQLFMDTPAGAAEVRAGYLRQSFAAYRSSYEIDPQKHFWHGINLAALAQLARSKGLAIDGGSTPEDYALALLRRLEAVPDANRDGWWHATRAECFIAQQDWPSAELELNAYLADNSIPSFYFGSTLRQLRDIWRIQDVQPGGNGTGARLLLALEAAVSRREGGGVLMATSDVAAARAVQGVDEDQLQRVIGDSGANTLAWYRVGLQRAAAVAAIKERLGLRFGTGFAVSSDDFNVQPGGETLLLTNWHVLNRSGLGGRTDFGNVEVVFEAADGAPVCRIAELIDESTAERGLDFALFRLRPGAGARLPDPVPISSSVEQLTPKKARVYVVGYPLGNELQFSLQDNQITDQECSATSTPPDPKRRRLQYLAATQKGSSGSPVFDESWDCVALHHAGFAGQAEGIPPLNGRSAYVKANEGIWIGSIQAFRRAPAAPDNT